MKKHLTILRRMACLLVSIYLMPGVINAQVKSFEQQRQEQLNKLDLEGLGNTLLLNNGVISEFEVNYFKGLSSVRNAAKSERVTSEEWQNLYERLIDTDLRPIKNGRIPDINSFIETNANKITKNNVIPIGILDFEGIFLPPIKLEKMKNKRRPSEKLTSHNMLELGLYPSQYYRKIYIKAKSHLRSAHPRT